MVEADAVGKMNHGLLVGDKKLYLGGGAVGADFFKVFQYPFIKGNANSALKDIYSIVVTEATAKALHLNLDADANLPEMETSRLYLEEILQNFITNSIKYTKEGSVTLGAKQLPGDKVKFFVTDTGIGMNKTDLDHIFEKFYRSEDYRTRETTGTGLGLYVVNKLAAKLDTKIEVESRLDHGSTFSFVLPVKSSRTTVKTEPATQLVS